MRNRLSYVLLAAAALFGCNNTNAAPDAPIVLMDMGGAVDMNVMMPDRNMTGMDTGDTCNGTGRVGAHCRSGSTNQCVNGAMCFAFTAVMDVQTAFGIPAGVLMDPAHPDYQMIDRGTSPETAPFNGAAGTICAQLCDSSVADTCGTCSTCSQTLTQMPLVAAFGGILAVLRNDAANRPYGGNTGICRLDCTYNATARSAECPDDAFACDRFGNSCVEACTTDNECNTVYGITYAGELVTIVNHDHPDVCNMTTGRCEQPAGTGTASAHVGTPCTSAADCPVGGICLNGGHCAEFDCTNPNTATSTCGGGTTPPGICLTANGTAHSSTLCLMGCTTATDCGPGNICNTLSDGMGGVFTIGPYTGYCIGVCGADDECIATESCTDYNTVDTSGAVVSNNGRCQPRCTRVGMIGDGTTGDCAVDEFCSPDATNSNGHACSSAADCTMAPYTMCSFGVCRSSAPTFGQCSPLGAFCGASNTNSLPAVQADCAMGQVCDETLATPHDAMGNVDREFAGDGHCTAPCTDAASCTANGYPAGSECVATGPLAGLCRLPCTMASAPDAGGMGDAGPRECPSNQICDTALHYCVEINMPAAAP